ncbi:unnamed protein product, partial [Brachionus calyciflorus]
MSLLTKISVPFKNVKTNLVHLQTVAKFSCVTNRLGLEHSSTVDNDAFDSYIVLGHDLEADLKKYKLEDKFKDLDLIKKNHKEFEKDLTFILTNNKRIIYSPTGPLNRDYDDVRQIAEASKKAMKKAIKIGSKKPLIINTVRDNFKLADQVALLAALEAAYNPLELREAKKAESLLKIEKLGYWNENQSEGQKTLDLVNAIELGRIVTRDIGGSDPERMSAQNVVSYINDVLESSNVKINVIEGQETFQKDYPCFAAVNRATQAVPRHSGRIVKLEYNESDQSEIDTTLLLVGKGITYDTGGADVKTGGYMHGMHRDKCGAAFVAGFFKTLSILKPKGLKVHGQICLTRNNIGEDAYVTDEIITSRSNKRIRVGNTDAEGRMAICDSLCEIKDLALTEKNPHIFTIATLTGHVVRSYGENYTGIMSNGPARNQEVDVKLQKSGEMIADPYEISRIRREDYEAHKGKSEYEDIMQCYSKPSAMTGRGHQGPAAFLIMASGLDNHGSDSEKPLSYTHVDIAGSSGKFPGIPTAAPLPSFVAEYILPR